MGRNAIRVSGKNLLVQNLECLNKFRALDKELKNKGKMKFLYFLMWTIVFGLNCCGYCEKIVQRLEGDCEHALFIETTRPVIDFSDSHFFCQKMGAELANLEGKEKDVEKLGNKVPLCKG